MSILSRDLNRRDFLRNTVAVAAGTGLSGCALKLNTIKTDDAVDSRVLAHVVESDTAIIDKQGTWVTVECWANCGGRCINKALVKDGVVLRQKTNDEQDDH